jgi:hypothetical protein
MRNYIVTFTIGTELRGSSYGGDKLTEQERDDYRADTFERVAEDWTGFTATDAVGAWRDQSGRLVSERSLVVTIATRPSVAFGDGGLPEIVADYADKLAILWEQDSVLWTLTRCKHGFSK